MNEADWKSQDPFALFETWLNQAKSTPAIREPTAMALATWSTELGPSNRIVLLKSASPNGFCFYTNYLSHKGKDLQEHPQAALVFYWDPLSKQIRITGNVKKTSRQESEAYWASRARESQLSQHISRQSEVVKDRAELEKLVDEANVEFKSKPVPCPAHWGGYVLEPATFEFWESRPGRLHDRLHFSKTNGHWTGQRLAP